jgi:dihydrofolate reductase
MAAYWPGALSEGAGTETNRAMARRMNSYKKLVFSRSGPKKLTEWNNTEQVVVGADDELAQYLAKLKAQPGGDIHLSGGASFAQSVIGLDLVDEFHFFVYPVVSPGASWFSRLPDKRDLQLLSASSFENGVVGLHYVPLRPAGEARPGSFSDLLT